MSPFDISSFLRIAYSYTHNPARHYPHDARRSEDEEVQREEKVENILRLQQKQKTQNGSSLDDGIRLYSCFVFAREGE